MLLCAMLPCCEEIEALRETTTFGRCRTQEVEVGAGRDAWDGQSHDGCRKRRAVDVNKRKIWVITRAWETADRVGADRVRADGRAMAKAGEAASSPRLALTPAEAAQALGCSRDSRSLYL